MEFKPSISPEQFDMMQGGGQPTSSASPSQKYAGGFDAAASFTLGEEGGYVKDDAGAGETNFGINKRANPDVDIKSLTESGARDLYKTRYWNPIGGDELAKRNPILATIAFDTAINMGPTTAKNFLRAANGDPAKVLEMRAERYRDLLAADPKKFGKYADGWQSRMDKLYELAGTQQPVAQPTNDFSGEGSTAGGIDWNAKEKGFVDRASEGFKRGFDQSIGLGQAAAALVNRTVTGEKYNEFQDEMLQAAGKRMQPEGGAPTPQFSDVVSGGANFKDWLADSVGYLGYQAVEMAASFGIGGLIGKNIAKGAVKEVAEGMIEKEVARLAATDAAKTLSKDEIGALAVKNVAGEIAGSMATFANNLRQTSGGVYMEALDNEAKTGKPADLTNAWVGSIGSALVDTAADIAGARGILGKAGSGNATFLGRAATQVPRQMGIQGGTEYLQSNIENAAAGTDPFTEKAQIQALNEGAVGALGGVFPGLGEARVQRATNPLQPVIDHAQKPGSVLSRAVVSTGVTDQAAAAAASEALPPAADDLVQRVRDVEAGMRNGPVLDNLRDDGVDTRELLNDMQLARRTDAPRAAREAALERIETAIHFANQDAQPRAPMDSIQNNPAFDFSPKEQPAAEPVPDVSAVATALRDPNLRNTISNEDRDQLLYLYNIAGNSKGDTVVRTNAARQALEIVGRYQTPVGTPGSTTPALEQAAQAGAAIATPAEQQTVAAEPKELDFLQAVPEPKVGIPAGEGPAFLRKRAAVVKQLVDNGFETVQRDSKDFYLTNTKTGQKFKLDGPADAQLARKAIKDRVDALAATNEKNPSQAKINANNYKKSDVIDLNGMKIKIENERGDIRRGVGPDGTPWETKMAHHYGEFQGTIGADGDKLDVFIGPRPDSNKVYVVDQVNQDGSFDEHKVMMGFTSKEDATAGYLANYEKGWTGLGAITEMSVDEFKTWAKSRAAKKPLAVSSKSATENFTEEEKAEEKPGFIYVNDGGKKRELRLVKPNELSKSASKKRDGKYRPITQSESEVLQQLAAALGKQVVFYEAQGGRLSDGFVMPNQPGTIFLATETTVNPLAVFGHEFFHTLRDTNPEAWNAIAAVVRSKVTNPKGFRKDYYGKKIANERGNAQLTGEQGGELEELVSDLGGNLLKDPKFWTQVFDKIKKDNGSKANGIIAKLSAAIQDAIGRIVKAMSQPGYRAESFVKDLDQVREAFVAAMAKHINEGASGNAASSSTGTLKKSEDRPGLTVEGYHFSKAPRSVLTTAMFGTGLKGSARDEIKSNPDKRLLQRLSFYVNKGTGINPEAGVGAIAHKATLTNIYDADADPLRLRTGDARAFESKVLDNKYSGYLQRMQGTQSGQVILLGKQTVQPEVLGAVGKITDAEAVPPPAQRTADAGDKIMASKDLPSGALTPTQWSEALMQEMPEVAAELMDIGAFKGDEAMYKDELVAKARQLSSQIKKSADRARDEYAEVEAKYKGTEQWLKAPNGKDTNLSERQWIQVRTPSFKNWFGDWEAAAKQNNLWSRDDVSKAVDANGEPLVVYHGTNKGGFSEFNEPGGDKRGDLGIFTTPNLAMAQTYYSRRGGEIDLPGKRTAQDLVDLGFEINETDDGKFEAFNDNGFSEGVFDTEAEAEAALLDVYGDGEIKGGDTSGYYALFINIRNPIESDFEGAHWNGERPGRYQVMNQDGELQYDESGKAYFDMFDDANEFAKTIDDAEVQPADDHYETTDSVVREARQYDNDGAIIHSVVDSGPGYSAYIDEPSDVFVALDPSQLKSANYNNGEFSVDSSDLRFATDRNYKLDIAREERAKAKASTLTEAEKAAIEKDGQELGLTAKQIKALEDEARRIKKQYPASEGWAPLSVVGVELKTDDEKNPIPGSEKPKFQAVAYGFNVPPGMTRAPTKTDEAWLKKVADKFEGLVTEIYDRAEQGDKNAQVIIGHQTWYRNVAEVLRREYGGAGDMLADLLGATSPNTPVDTNWRFSVDIMRRFMAGEFNDQLKKFAAYVDDGGDASKYPAADKIRQISGKLYGMNSTNAMKALLDMWRAIEPGQAPKARNFALNLIGQSNMATIDVWAARMLRRAANLVRGADLARIPPPAEMGVSGVWNASSTKVTGAFGFGADVMDKVSKALEKRGIKVTPPDLQAIAWFAEKELWGQKGWTTKTGEGGSFEENIEATPVERYLAGWSIQQGEKVPGAEESSVAQARVLSMLIGDDSVVSARVMPTTGLYGGAMEASFDTEWTVTKGQHDPSLVMAEIARIAKENEQFDIFVSKVVGSKEDNPNARPGVEIYFKNANALQEALPVLKKFTEKGQDGFTMMVDPRVTPNGVTGEEFIGVRLQYVPEISMRWDPQLRRKLLAPGGIERVLKGKRQLLEDIATEVGDMDGVAFATLQKYDTVVVGKENYDEYIDRGLEGSDNAPGSQAWFGQQIRQGLEGAAARLRGDVRQDGAGGVSDAGSRLLSQVAAAADTRSVLDAGRIRRSPERLDVEGRPNQGAQGREVDGSLNGLPREFTVDGLEIRASHWAPAENVARLYMAEAGLPYSPPAKYAKVDPQRASRIAAEYDKLKHDPQNPEVKAAYAALARETIAQYQAVVDSGLTVEFIDFAKQGDPYAASPRLMTEDVRLNNHMYVFSTRDGFGSDVDFNPIDNPLLAETDFIISGKKALVNDLFRVVHDYFGHVKEGVGFRADGEENTWRAHSAMFSPLAQRALTTETRGQNSWVNYGPHGEKNRKASAGDTHYADQKVGLLPKWVSEEGKTDEPTYNQRVNALKDLISCLKK